MKMDKYFCSHCLKLWKQDKTMNGCQGCDAHIKKGWTTQQLVEIYEPILVSSDADRAYFPFLHYEYQPRLMSNPKNHSNNQTNVDYDVKYRLFDWLQKTTANTFQKIQT